MSPPADPKASRYTALSKALRVAVWVAVALSLGGVVLPSSVGASLAAALVALLIAVPLARVVWLVQRWFRRGDLRFGLVGLGVLVIVAVGALIAS